MSNDILKKFAEELKIQREKKDISLEEIYGKTRINAKHLESIEQGNFDVVPDVYIRAFLREYSSMIELDPDETIKKYELAKKGKLEGDKEAKGEKQRGESSDKIEIPKTSFGIGEKSKSLAGDSQKPFIKNIILFSGTVIIIIAAIVSYFLLFNDSSDEIIVERPFEEIIEEKEENIPEDRFEIIEPEIVAQSQKEPEQSQKEPEQFAQMTDSLSLKINAIDTSWFRILIDDVISDEFILNPNRSKTIKATNKFEILIGNTGAVELVLNGNILQLEGDSAEIKNIRVDSTGLHYLKINKPSSNE